MVSQSVNGSSENNVNFAVPESVIESTWDEVFAAASRDVPDARFLSSWSSGEGRVVDTLTFHDLYSRGLAVAVRLRNLSAQPSDGIALLSHPSVELYACVVGVFALGAHCVNLNWRQPAPVLARAVVETTGARFLVASGALGRLADAIENSFKDDAPRSLPFARFELLGAANAGSRISNGAPGLTTGPLSSEEAAGLVHHESPAAPIRDLPACQNVAADAVTRISSHRDALEPALVMFTSGSTGKPKGVPITHKGALWACRTKLDAHNGIDNVRPNGTLSFLPNFHVIGFINNFLFNALCRVPCSVHAEAATAILTAEIFAMAASHLQPDAVDTVPAILEALGREAIERGPAEGRALLAPFARAKMVSCGGAPLSSSAYDALSKMGVAVVPHYGQTELGGGFCLMGRPRAGRDLMRPVRGVRILVLADSEPRIETLADLEAALAKHDGRDSSAPIFGAEQGEAIVLGCGSATPGYARQPGPVVPFAQCRSTGDVFERVIGSDGVVWLRHVCRRDDVIIHATGELTNPLPMEDAALRSLGQHAKRVAVVGQRRPSPIMFVEEAYPGAREKMDISNALAIANESAPAYSRVSSTRVIVVEPGDIPVSGKGNVVRNQLELKYQDQMDALDVELAKLEESLNSLSANSKRQNASRRHALTSMPVEDVQKIVLAAAKELIGTADLPTDAPLLSAGLNSTGLVQLVSVLSDKLSIPDLKPTLIFDHPSVDAVVAFVTSVGEEQFLDGSDRRSLNNEPPQLAAPNVASQVLRSPPNVRTASDFAARGAALFDAVGVVPLRKWDIEAVETSTERLPTHAAASVRYGAFLDAEIEGSFDCTVFRSKRIEVNAMDPQQRLLLDVGYEALHDSGYDRRSLMDAEIGTFTGIMNMDAPALAPAHHDLNAYVMLGSGYSALGARISYTFAIRGPCHVFDTACSSSLIAAHVARRCLGKLECEAALVAAPNLMLLPGFLHIGTAIMGMNSSRGRCHTLDDKADGFVRGEGAGAIVLKPAAGSASVACCGTAAKHNGRSASFTALNGYSQTLLIRAALSDAHVTGADITHLEAHGTGTALGDPIEVSGACAGLCGTDRVEPLRIAGVKANSGHAESAAGVTGLVAACVALHFRLPVPCAQLKRLNPQVRDVMTAEQLIPAVEACPLSAAASAKAGCSSFGWSGIIAHAVSETLEPYHIGNKEDDAVGNRTKAAPPSLYRARIEIPRLGGRGPPRPLLHNVMSATPHDALLVAETRIVGKLYASLQDHVVGGTILLPGVASIELALSAILRSLKVPPLAPVTLALSDVIFARPCVLSNAVEVCLKVIVRQDGTFEVLSTETNVYGRFGDEEAFERFNSPRSIRAEPTGVSKLVTAAWGAKRFHGSQTTVDGKVFVPATVASVSLRLKSAVGQTGQKSWAYDRALRNSTTEQIADATLISGGTVALKYASLRTRAIASLAKPRDSEKSIFFFGQRRRRRLNGPSAPENSSVVLVSFQGSTLATSNFKNMVLKACRRTVAHFDMWVHVVASACDFPFDDFALEPLKAPLLSVERQRPVIVNTSTLPALDADALRQYILHKADEELELVQINAAMHQETDVLNLGARAAVMVRGTDPLSLSAANALVHVAAAVVVECSERHILNLPLFRRYLQHGNAYVCTGDIAHTAAPFVRYPTVVVIESRRPKSSMRRSLIDDGRRCGAHIVFSSLVHLGRTVDPSTARLCGIPHVRALATSSMRSNEAIASEIAAGWSRLSLEAVLFAVTKPALLALRRPENAAMVVPLPVSERRAPKTPATMPMGKRRKATGQQDMGDDRRAVLATVTNVAASLAGLDRLDSDAPLMEKGIDSLAATELSQSLTREFGFELPSTLLFDFPTAGEIASFVASKVAATNVESTATVESTIDADMLPNLDPVLSSDAAPFATEKTVFYALGCRLPATDTVDELRQLTKLGLDAGSTVPLSRWDASSLSDKLSPQVEQRAKYGVFLRNIGQLDAELFRVTPLEASTLDPQQKLILEVGYAMLNDAGKTRDSLAGSSTGVFLGMMNADASELVPEVYDLSPFDLTGNGYSAAAARLSYVFAMRGPCQTVDTACSSTLVAVHAARQALRSHETDDAVVLGPNLHLHQGVNLVGGAIAAMNSARGRCHTLDSRADGYLRAEGCGGTVLTLKAEGEEYLTTFATGGAAVKHNGRAASFTALNGSAQKHLIEAAVDDAAVAPGRVSFLEMHGTGTALGDPVEVGAASNLYAEGRDAGKPGLALAAIKANIGHTESSAGIAGILKALVLLGDDDVGRNVQLRYINVQVANVLAKQTRCSVEPAPNVLLHHSVCGVSSFGFSGIIAHTVLKRDYEVAAADAQLFFKKATRPSLYRSRRFFHYDTLPDSRLVSSVKARHAANALIYDGAIIRQQPCAWTITKVITQDLMLLMSDHCVRGVPLFAGVGLIEMAFSALIAKYRSDNGRSDSPVIAQVNQVQFLHPVEIELGLKMSCTIKGDGSFEISLHKNAGAIVACRSSSGHVSAKRGAVDVPNVSQARTPSGTLASSSILPDLSRICEVARSVANVHREAKSDEDSYTLIPAGIDAVTLDVNAVEGKRFSENIATFVQRIVTKTEERADASLHASDTRAPTYQVHTLIVKATGPPKKTLPDQTMLYSIAAKRSQANFGLVRRKRWCDGLSYEYRTLPDSRVTVVLLSCRAAASPPPYRPALAFKPQTAPPGSSLLGILGSADLVIRMPNIATLASVARLHLPDGPQAVEPRDASMLSRLSDTTFFSASILRDDEHRAVLALDTLDHQLTTVDYRQVKEPARLVDEGLVVLLGSSKLAWLATLAANASLTLIASNSAKAADDTLRRLEQALGEVVVTTVPNCSEDMRRLALLSRRLAGDTVRTLVIGDHPGAATVFEGQGQIVSTVSFRPTALARFSVLAAQPADGLARKTLYAGVTATTFERGPELFEKILVSLSPSLMITDIAQISPARGRVQSKGGGSSRRRALAPRMVEEPRKNQPAQSKPQRAAKRSKAQLVTALGDIAKSLVGKVPEPLAPLMASGFDSLTTNDFTKKISLEFDVDSLPSTLLFDHPTIDSLADYLDNKLVPPASSNNVHQPEAAQVSVPMPPPRTAERRNSRPPRRRAPAQNSKQQRVLPAAKRGKTELVAALGEIAKSLVGKVPEMSAPLMASGFDSLTTNDFSKKISMEFDIDSLPSTILFDHPTLESLADYLDHTITPLALADPALSGVDADVDQYVDEEEDYDDASYEQELLEYLGDADVHNWSLEDHLATQNLAGRVAILAGASRGIGRAIAIALAKRGCNCAIFGQSTVREVAEACEAAGPPGTRAIGLKVDLRERSKVEEAIDKVRAELGDRLDILVQSASVHRGGHLLAIDERGFDFVLRTNVIGTSNIVHTCEPLLRRSPHAQILLVAPAAISAKSWLRFARGSTIYCSAKLMMGFYLEIWREWLPGVSMSTLWPKYVVESAATDSKQGSNKHLQSDNSKMVKPVFMGEAAALALTRPPPTSRLEGRVDFHLDADIHDAMDVGRARNDFLKVRGKSWDELEVCFQVDISGRGDLVEVFEADPATIDALPPDLKVLVVGAFSYPVEGAAVLVFDDGEQCTSKSNQATFVADAPADCGNALDAAIDSLGGELDLVLLSCDVDGVREDLDLAYDRLVKFPFFVLREIKRRRDHVRLPCVVATAAPPDVFPLAGASIRLNEVLLDRSLITLAIALELEQEDQPMNPSMRLCWWDGGYAKRASVLGSRKARSRLPSTRLLNSATLNWAVSAEGLKTPPSSCAMLRDHAQGRSPALCPKFMCKSLDTLDAYSEFPPSIKRNYWFSPAPPKSRRLMKRDRRPTPSIVATRFVLPGFCDRDIGELRNFLAKGGNALTTVPPGRWDTPVPGAEHSAIYGAFLGDRFTADFECTGMVAVEARWCDPQQLLVLEACCGSAHESLRGSGETRFDRHALAGANVGMFLGCGGVTYGSGGLASVSSLRRDPKFSLYTGTSSTLSVVAGRVPYALGLIGPCLSIDTACCSSLVATHVAVAALAADECEAALSATVGLLSEPASTAFSIAGMFSATGRCHTFDAAADGYARGEGCLSYMLDPRAGEDGAVPPGFLGSAVQQDGVSASLTAPNGTAQRRLIGAVANSESDGVAAWESLEAHGTGTALGDPIEVGAASAVLCSSAESPARCTSFKANVGHLESAAAGAGFVALAAATLAGGVVSLGMSPNARLKRLNGHLVGFVRGSPFYMPVESTLAAAAPFDSLDTCRLSSFGYSGTIAHARFEAAVSSVAVEAEVRIESKPELFRSRVLLPIIPPVDRSRVKLQAATSDILEPLLRATGGTRVPAFSIDDDVDYDDDEELAPIAVDVGSIVNEVIGFQVDINKPLMDVGLDSFVAGELMNQLSSAARADLPATLLFDYPSVASLDKFLQSDEVLLLGNEENDEERAERRRKRAEQRRKQQLTIISGDAASNGGRRANRLRVFIGAEARSPCGMFFATDLSSVQARALCAVTKMPNSRFDEDSISRASYPVAATYGGFIPVEDIEFFTMEAFALSRGETLAMDPQQRLVLEVGQAALLREGGYSKDELLGANIGCYVGIQTSDFFDLARRPGSGVSQTYLATGANHAVASGRLPYALGLRGASMAISTACSTALVCTHQARAGLELSQDSPAALIVAVNLNLVAAMTVSVARAGMLSAQGRCHTLDERADGYVRSEGCVALLVRTDNADKSSDSTSSLVISSTAVRSDGKSASLTAPSGLAQQQLLREALSEAVSSSTTVDEDPVPRHVEMHGTGTALGDPIEIGAIAAVSSRRFRPTVGAVKANVGHAETCSGAFGLSVLARIALAKQQAAPQACLLQLNSRLGHFADRFIGPVGDLLPRSYVAGGVSSFGFSGAIAHVSLDLTSTGTRMDKLDNTLDAECEKPRLVSERTASFRSFGRFRLVESRAPTPAVQKASAEAVVARSESLKSESVAEDDKRPVTCYEMRWVPRDAELAPAPPMTLIIGAGLDGVLCAAALARNGVPYLVYEKNPVVAGVWVTMANNTSKVQTGKLTYTLDLSDPSPDVARESNYAPADEVCTRISEFALRFGIDRHIYTGREVLSVSHEDDGHVVEWREVATGVVTLSKFGAVVFAAGALRAPTLAPILEGAASYRGFDSYGVAADMAPCEMANRDVVICGHGAYGVENVRTGLEHGAKSITVVCRHRHSVLPRCAVYLLDAGREFNAWSEISAMLDLSKLSPAYTTDRRKRPAVSDQYYVAMRYGKASIVHGSVTGFDTAADGRPVAIVDGVLRVPADVTLLCYGFSKETKRVNEIMRVEELTGIWVNGRRTAAILKADLDVRREATPLSASNIPFATFLANTIAQFLKRPRDFEKVRLYCDTTVCVSPAALQVLPRLPKADISQDTTSFDFFASMFLGLVGNPDVKPQLDKVTRLVQHSSVRDVQCWGSFVDDCAADWRRYCSVCKGEKSSLPYANWLERPLPLHKDGYAVTKRNEKDDLVAPSAANHWVTVVGCTASKSSNWAGANRMRSDAVAQRFVGKSRRPAATLCVVHPQTLDDLAVLTKFAATSDKVAATLVILSNQLPTTPFLAQVRVARVELPKLKLSTVSYEGGRSPRPGQFDALLLGLSKSADVKIGESANEMVPTLCSWTERKPVNCEYAEKCPPPSLGGRALVTGGTGALGIVAAALLVESGEASFVCIGARQPRVRVLADVLVPRLNRLALCGRATVVANADTSDPHAMHAFSRVDPFVQGPVGVVIHAAGVLHDVMLAGLEKWMAEKVIAPKVACLSAIRAVTEASDKGRFVGFSSASVTLGGPGQTAYASASGELDAYSERARSRGSFASTVQWLAVRGVGMHQEAVGSAPQWTPLRRVEEVLTHLTKGLYPPAAALRPPPCSVSVLPEAFLKFLPPTVSLAAADDPSLRPSDAAESQKTAVRKKRPKAKSKKKDDGGAAALVEAALKNTLENVVEGYDPATGEDMPFMEMGVDSMGLTDFVNSLNQTLKVDLPEVALFEHPTIRDLRAALLEMVDAGGDVDEDDDEYDDDIDFGAQAPVAQGSLSRRAGREAPRVVIAAMCGSLPLGDLVDNQFWAALRSGACAIGRLPLNRVHSSLLGVGVQVHRHRAINSTDDDALRALELPATARYGGFVETRRWVSFDHEAFSIGGAEAKVMDPQQRQLLETGLGALEAAGMGLPAIRKGAAANEPWTVGNFVALQTNDFARAIVRTPKLVASTYAVSGANPAIAAGRLGYALGLRGAAMCVDTACSTALVCLHEARLSFFDTPNEPALVSAVNAMIDASVTEVVERAGMLSPRGRCHTFDARADGYCRGEGIVCVVLRPVPAGLDGASPLSAVAEASRSADLASTSLRSDGRTASITAPSGTAQRELLLKARYASPLTDEIVCAVECHGTGTALGDPIEIGALATHVDKHEITSSGRDVFISGIKANVGHLEPAAGFAGLAALAVAADAQAVSNIQLHSLNPQLQSALVASHVRQLCAGVDSVTPLPSHRRVSQDVTNGGESYSAACVSSFGFSGIIAHARLSYGAPWDDPALASNEAEICSAPVSLFRKRVDLEWLNLVEPLVYGLDRHAREAPERVGQFRDGPTISSGSNNRREAWGEEEILAGVRAIVESLGDASGDDDTEFADMGIDSIASTELSRALAAKFDVGKLSPSFVFDNPTIATAAKAVVELLADSNAGQSTIVEAEANSLIVAFGPHRRTHRGAMFLWSGGQGDASAFARLGSRLSAELRVYGIDRAEGLDVGAMADKMASAIAGRVPPGDAACYIGGLSIGGWIGVESAIRLERDFGTRVEAVFTIDGAPPCQLDAECVYEPEVGASELLKGRGFALPDGWRQMTPSAKVDKFMQLMPSLGIDFIGNIVGPNEDKTAAVKRDLRDGATRFLKTLQGGSWDPATTKLPQTEIVAIRAAERNQVRMLDDSDLEPHPHLYTWVTPGVPNVRVIDFPANHLHLLMYNNLLDTLAATILASTDRRNRPG